MDEAMRSEKTDGNGGGEFALQSFGNEQLQRLFQIIYQVSKTRGYKTVVKLLPHEVADLEPVVGLLKRMDRTDHTWGMWECRYSLFLWLSMLVAKANKTQLVYTQLMYPFPRFSFHLIWTRSTLPWWMILMGWA